MFKMEAFADELVKIAETKCRSGSTPIRVHNLLKREVHDGRKAHEKSAAAASAVSPELKAIGSGAAGLAKRHAGKALLVGGGILGWEQGKQALNDYRMGREYRRQMQQ